MDFDLNSGSIVVKSKRKTNIGRRLHHARCNMSGKWKMVQPLSEGGGPAGNRHKIRFRETKLIRDIR